MWAVKSSIKEFCKFLRGGSPQACKGPQTQNYWYPPQKLAKKDQFKRKRVLSIFEGGRGRGGVPKVLSRKIPIPCYQKNGCNDWENSFWERDGGWIVEKQQPGINTQLAHSCSGHKHQIWLQPPSSRPRAVEYAGVGERKWNIGAGFRVLA